MPVPEGSTALPFTLLDSHGKSRASSEFHASGPALLCFYKTDCPTCNLAFPFVETIHQAYRSAGLTVMGIGQDDADELNRFQAQHGATFLQGSDAPPYPIFRSFDVAVTPTLILLGQHGQVLRSLQAWDRTQYNALSEHIASLAGVPVAVVSCEGDGAPPFRPG